VCVIKVQEQSVRLNSQNITQWYCSYNMQYIQGAAKKNDRTPKMG